MKRDDVRRCRRHRVKISKQMPHQACNECEPIARKLGEAYADAWAPSDQESREAWFAIHKLKGGTEEDVVHAV